MGSSMISMRFSWISGTAVGCVFAILLACVPDASASLELSLNERIRNSLRVRCETDLGAVVEGASLRLNTTTPPADCFSMTHSNGIMDNLTVITVITGLSQHAVIIYLGSNQLCDVFSMNFYHQYVHFKEAHFNT